MDSKPTPTMHRCRKRTVSKHMWLLGRSAGSDAEEKKGRTSDWVPDLRKLGLGCRRRLRESKGSPGWGGGEAEPVQTKRQALVVAVSGTAFHCSAYLSRFGFSELIKNGGKFRSSFQDPGH